jgi:hypothetical protein
VPWVRFDDQFPINRKVSRLSDAAFRLHVSAVFWCARNLTDGAVPEEDLDDVCARVRTPERFVTEIVGRGLWHEIGYQCDSDVCLGHPDNAVSNTVTKGWVIHDYLEYQPSKSKVLDERKGNAERQKKWREQRKQEREERNGVSNAVSNGGSNATPSRPVPSRRDGGSLGADVEGDQSVRAQAREREAVRHLSNTYGLTDEESRTVWAEAERRASVEIKYPVKYLNRMADEGHLADVVEAVQQASEPPPEPGPPPLRSAPSPPSPPQEEPRWAPTVEDLREDTKSNIAATRMLLHQAKHKAKQKPA